MTDTSEAHGRIPIGVRAVYIVLFTITTIAITMYVAKGYGERLAFFQTLILALTLIVLIIYTEYTRRMQQAMIRQISVSILPIFVASLFNDGEKHHVRLTNVGNSVALNVRIDSIPIQYTVLDDTPNPPGRDKIVHFSSVQSIGVKEIGPFQELQDRPAKGGISKLASTTHLDILKFLQPANAVRDYKLTVRFLDILGNRYSQIILINNGGIVPGVVQQDFADRIAP